MHREELRNLLATIDRENRDVAAVRWELYWDRRHDLARRTIDEKSTLKTPTLPAGMPANNEIDKFIAARLAEENVIPDELTDDFAFMRRVTLDTVGVVPSRR